MTKKKTIKMTDFQKTVALVATQIYVSKSGLVRHEGGLAELRKQAVAQASMLVGRVIQKMPVIEERHGTR